MEENAKNVETDPTLLSKNQPFRCYHCGKICKDWQGLMGHLRDCPKRQLTRKFDVGDYRFILLLNPRKKVIAALTGLVKEHPKNDKLFLGAVMGFNATKQITSFQIEEIQPAAHA